MPERTTSGKIAAVINTCLEPLGLTMSRLPERNSMERNLQTALGDGHIGCVIDVGAHDGGFGSMVRSIGYKGRIVSFEPGAAAFERLQALSAADRNWDVHRLCLGNEEGTVDLKKFSGATFNSLHTPSKFATSSWMSGYLESQGSEAIPIRRLDGVLPELKIDPQANLYLKIDTQGHDLQVLEGARGLLGRVPSLQMELSALCVYDGTPTMEEVIAACRKLGYLPHGFTPVHRPVADQPVVEWDGIFYRVPPQFEATAEPAAQAATMA